MTFSHPALVILLQVIIGLLTGNWLIGGLFLVGFYIGREITQAEYRWIERFGLGRRSNMPWWGGFDPKVWNWDSESDFLLPVLACLLVFGISVL